MAGSNRKIRKVRSRVPPFRRSFVWESEMRKERFIALAFLRMYATLVVQRRRGKRDTSSLLNLKSCFEIEVSWYSYRNS